ncbi:MULTISPECIES: hypothetical protein [Paenibacillus]|uniref:Uncharacterized protein n=2 Tax=Paenibacillus TaxID=44249 RepID=A0ABX2ZAG3_PAEPO|nr:MULTISPECIES: hypothetical protein [Paenibacillus]MDR6779429.1 hypothetical protein [Paenibacillus peoriae]ODA08320.1 hypothetical protein A7312_27675 [Paenibacillus polymyxa]
MPQILTRHMIETAYKYSRKVYHNELELSSALSHISLLSGMHRGTALAYISDFCSMMEGQAFKRKMTADATKYYLLNIYKDYGIEALNGAVAAVKLHIKYFKEEKSLNLVRLTMVVKEFDKGLVNNEIVIEE